MRLTHRKLGTMKIILMADLNIASQPRHLKKIECRRVITQSAGEKRKLLKHTEVNVRIDIEFTSIQSDIKHRVYPSWRSGEPEVNSLQTTKELPMSTRRQIHRLSLIGLTSMAVAVLAGCGMMKGQSESGMASSNMVAFSTQLRSSNEVPPVASPGTGSVDAAFNKSNNMLRWKVTYSGLTGPATAGHFHGPAAAGANAGVVLGWTGAMSPSMEGSATLTAAQAADLMAGRWYANIHTAAHPGGEIRGQMTARN